MTKETDVSSVKSLSRLFVFLLVVVLIGIAGVVFYALQTLPPYAAKVNLQLQQANLLTSVHEPGEPLSESVLNGRALKFFAPTSNYQSKLRSDIQAYARLTSTPVGDINIGPVDQSIQGAPISISINGPIAYSNLLQFITALEGNVPKISVSDVTISRINTTPESVTVGALKVTVLVK